ncbi:MAG: stage V sporulation protein AA [Defluviitaleaceae bacterium]|nr:stage V sporulation protein AA [Defluviitaleaceae bacterium]MCL2836443.1 stage V sporulation protein AA [Defluviitaleaceae bacterium]
MDIYVKPAKKAAVSGESHITVGHVCEVQAPPEIKERVERVKLFATEGDKKKMHLVSVIDVIKAIDQSLPGHTVNNVGEMDTIVLYHAHEQKDIPFWKWLKITLIGLVFAIGAATAIMSFHNDAEIPKVFKAYHKMFTGQDTDKPRAIQISYVIGIAGGIIVFFNHLGGRKIKEDPSPIEIEMSDYDKTVTETLVDFLAARKNKYGGENDGSS